VDVDVEVLMHLGCVISTWIRLLLGMFDDTSVTATHSTNSSWNLPNMLLFWKDMERGTCVIYLAVVKMLLLQINWCWNNLVLIY